MPTSDSISLINTIPPEILGHILILHHEALGCGKFTKELGAVFLTCKYWNELASSIPELWCDFEIVLDSRINLPFLSISTIKSWLSRSKDRPLNLVLNFQHLGPGVDSSGQNYAEVAFDLFLAHFVRWRSVSFNFGPRFGAKLPSLTTETIAPLLETIDITFNPWSGAHKTWYLSLYDAAPSLRNYINRGSYGGAFLLRVSTLPWAQLSHFRLECASDPRHIYGVLEKASSLQNCHFVLLHPSSISLTSPQIGRFERIISPIRCLSVQFFFTPETCPLLNTDVLLTPNLEDFKIHFPPTSNVSQHNLLYSYLDKLQSPLYSFTIRNMTLSGSQLLACLQLLSPSLTAFNIQTDQLKPGAYKAMETVTTAVLKALMYKGYGSEVLCPNLRSLTFERCLGSDDGILGDMIMSRWRPFHPLIPGALEHCISPIKHFGVVFRFHTHEKDAKMLENLYKEGLPGQLRSGLPSMS